MPITVDYGPIGIAMGLGTAAGQNLATQTNNQNDLSLLGYAQRAQAMNNQQRATEIQESQAGEGLSLEQQRNIAQQNLANAQLQSSSAYKNASLQGLNAYREGRNDIGQQNADTAGERADNQADYNTGRLGVSQQRADTADQGMNNLDVYHTALANTANANASTRATQVSDQNTNSINANNSRQQDSDTRQLQGEFTSLAQAAKAHESSFGDPNDPQYLAVKSRMNQIMQSMQQRYRASDMPQAPAPTPAPQPQQQQSDQQQPGATPATAVTISGSADFQQLPSGAYYTGPDGVLRQKP